MRIICTIFLFLVSKFSFSQDSYNDNLYMAVLKSDTILVKYYCEHKADANFFIQKKLDEGKLVNHGSESK